MVRVYTRVFKGQADAVKRRLDAIADDSVLERALDLSAIKVEREAAIRAPVDTGFMYSGLFIEKLKNERLVGTDAPYAWRTEYSQRALKGHTPENPRTEWPAKSARGGGSRQTLPWLRPALLVSQDYIKATFAAALKRVMRGGYG